MKIVFELPEDDWHGYARESVWAEVLSHGKYRLQNVPFAVYGYSYDDVVAAVERDGDLIVTEPIMRGGHSTFRIFLAESMSLEDERFQAAWRPLRARGCTFERASQRLFGVDVPPKANYGETYKLLEQGRDLQIWECEQAHRGHTDI